MFPPACGGCEGDRSTALHPDSHLPRAFRQPTFPQAGEVVPFLSRLRER